MFQQLVRIVVGVVIDLDVEGLENLPAHGPLIVVINHLADSDALVGFAVSPWAPEAMAKAELREVPIVGRLMDAYGVIWVQPFSADRPALRTALDALAEGRVLALAPEGRESQTGALEAGTGGAAFLALRSGAPVAPVALMGTERVYNRLKRLRRTRVSLRIGELFELEHTGDRRRDLSAGTEQIMQRVAALLPPEYRGVYA